VPGDAKGLNICGDPLWNAARDVLFSNSKELSLGIIMCSLPRRQPTLEKTKDF